MSYCNNIFVSATVLKGLKRISNNFQPNLQFNNDNNKNVGSASTLTLVLIISQGR